jgi:hypothetical protein
MGRVRHRPSPRRPTAGLNRPVMPRIDWPYRSRQRESHPWRPESGARRRFSVMNAGGPSRVEVLVDEC